MMLARATKEVEERRVNEKKKERREKAPTNGGEKQLDVISHKRLHLSEIMKRKKTK